ncbi:Pre-mRNA-splicing factor CLF1 [Pelomyxa schiedti]|nr:Pre-mRNA-splicing factor CLF1 [Pelomyxa schiedti]
MSSATGAWPASPRANGVPSLGLNGGVKSPRQQSGPIINDYIQQQQQQQVGSTTSPRSQPPQVTVTFNAQAPAYIPLSAKTQTPKCPVTAINTTKLAHNSGTASSNTTTPAPSLGGLGSPRTVSIVTSPRSLNITSPRNLPITSPRNATITSPRNNTITSPRSVTVTSPRSIGITSPRGISAPSNAPSSSYTPPGSPSSSLLHSLIAASDVNNNGAHLNGPYSAYTMAQMGQIEDTATTGADNCYRDPGDYYEDQVGNELDYQDSPRRMYDSYSYQNGYDEGDMEDDDGSEEYKDKAYDFINGPHPGVIWDEATNQFRPDQSAEKLAFEKYCTESDSQMESGLEALHLLDDYEGSDGSLNDMSSIDMGLWGSPTTPLTPDPSIEDYSLYNQSLIHKSSSLPFMPQSTTASSGNALRKQLSFPVPIYRGPTPTASPNINPTTSNVPNLPISTSPPPQTLPITSRLAQEQEVCGSRISRSVPPPQFIPGFILNAPQVQTTEELQVQCESDQGWKTEHDGKRLPEKEDASFSYFHFPSGFQPTTVTPAVLMQPPVPRSHSADHLESSGPPPLDVGPTTGFPPPSQSPAYSMPQLNFTSPNPVLGGKPPQPLSPRSLEQQSFKPLSPRSQEQTTKFPQNSPRGDQPPYKLPLSSPRSVEPSTGYKLPVSPRSAEYKLSPRSIEQPPYKPLSPRSGDQQPSYKAPPLSPRSAEQLSLQQSYKAISPRGTDPQAFKTSPRPAADPQQMYKPLSPRSNEQPFKLSPRGDHAYTRQPLLNTPTVPSIAPTTSLPILRPDIPRSIGYPLDLPPHSTYDMLSSNAPLPLPQESPRQYAPQDGSINDDALLIHNKRGELVESPNSRLSYKMFYRKFKQTEKDEGLKAAVNFALRHLSILPHKVHWRVYLEMADMAKRENVLEEARDYYEKVTELQPYACQGWLEYAKMEEEYGRVEACRNILARGLNNCSYNESLMLKAIKLEEKLGNLDAARSLLSRVKHFPVEKTWKTMLEGALLEARNGNITLARHIFRYLIRHAPWFGPIYQEAYRFEEKYEFYDKAVTIVETGLKQCTRYGPLWFSALRIHEKISKGNLEKTRLIVERAVQQISKELVWKIYFEAAQIEDRAGNCEKARDMYVHAVFSCPENLLWKIWLGGARTELGADEILVGRMLVRRALQEVPLKMRPTVLLDKSRLEEYAGDIEAARNILSSARKEYSYEWKVYLESVLLEIRAGNIPGALAAVKEALKIHTSTGRLWAVFIQLKQSSGTEAQMKVFQKALREVPKSGEVWCEGARIYLYQNDFKEAKKALKFAIQFTPQYGDSFIECLHRKILCKGISCDTDNIEQRCINAEPNYGPMWLHCKTHPLDSSRQVLRTAKQLLIKALADKCPVGAGSAGNHSTITALSLPPANQPGEVPPNTSSASAPSSPKDQPDDEATNSLFNLNAMHQCHAGVIPAERRKLIFGSDQIKP